MTIIVKSLCGTADQEQKDSKCVSVTRDVEQTDINILSVHTEKCELDCCDVTHAHIIERRPQKKGARADFVHYQIKIGERCFLCPSIEFCPVCNKCPNCCSRSTCIDKTTPFLRNLGCLGGQSKGLKNL